MASTGAYAYMSPEEHTKITREAVRLQLEAARLYRRVNASRPVMRLPNELLAEVFVLCTLPRWNIDPERVAHTLDLMKLSDYKWLRVAHVCHHWRTVALGTPALWVDIEATRPDLVASFVARSGVLPLTVSFCWTPAHTSSALWPHILGALPRVRTLVLETNNTRYLPAATEGAQQGSTLSELRSLRLYSLAHCSSLVPPFLLPPSELPALRALSISRLYFSGVRHLLVPSLTSLRLQAPYIRDVSDWRPLLEALDQIPQLEDLTIEDTYPLPENYIEMPPLSDKVARLPSLRSLHIMSRYAGVAAALLLQSLCFPGDAVVRMGEHESFEIGFHEDEQLEPLPHEDVSCLLYTLEQRLAGRSTGDLTPHPQVLSLCLALSADDAFIVQAWSSHIVPNQLIKKQDLAGPGPTDTPCFSIHWPPAAVRMNSFLHLIDSLPSLQKIQSLMLLLPAGGDDWTVWEDVEELQGVLAHFSQLQTILVSGPARATTLAALRTPHEPSEATMLPALKHLHLGGYHFDDSALENDGTGGDSQEGYDALKNTLETRARSGLPLHTLSLLFCQGLKLDMIEDLRGLVAELAWDGSGCDRPE